VPTRLISAADVRRLVPMADAIDAVRDAFLDLAAGVFEMPTRTALHGGEFLVMSVEHLPTRTAMVKTISLNFARTPAISGSVHWSEHGSLDEVVADAAAVTALRTGAISGVATDLLARPDASDLVVFGAGAQAIDQVRAVHAVRPVRRVTVFAPRPLTIAGMFAALSREHPHTDFQIGSDLAGALAGADIVCCATPSKTPLFAADALRADVHVNAIGSFLPTMRELPDALLASSTIVVDELDAILAESGEVLHALDAGAIVRSDLQELGVALRTPRDHAGGRTVFKTVGVAVQDWAIARLLAASTASNR
jgi:ornithine cyclodeaminase/alanine dehydrogenase-like protein (mu-crystallin family)